MVSVQVSNPQAQEKKQEEQITKALELIRKGGIDGRIKGRQLLKTIANLGNHRAQYYYGREMMTLAIIPCSGMIILDLKILDEGEKYLLMANIPEAKYCLAMSLLQIACPEMIVQYFEDDRLELGSKTKASYRESARVWLRAAALEHHQGAKEKLASIEPEPLTLTFNRERAHLVIVEQENTREVSAAKSVRAMPN